MTKLFFPFTGGRAEWRTTVGQSWDVTESKTASGRRRTLCQQMFPNWTFSLNFNHINKVQRDELLAFYASVRGNHKAFYFKDYEHHVSGQRLGTTANGGFQCVINHGGFVEPTSYVENLVVYLDGIKTTNYTETDGVINIPNVGSAIVTADYDYWWKVAFTGGLSVEQIFENVYNFSLKLEVVRE